MTDETRGPQKRGPQKRGPKPGPANFGDRELREQLSGLEPPAHRSDFWTALDTRIDLVTALKNVETPEHQDGFWASFDTTLRSEPERQLETAEVVSLRTTVFDDALLAPKRTRRHRQPFSRRRLEHLVQLSAAAAVVALLAGALAWWGTRDQTDTIASTAATTTVTKTTVGGPSTSAPVSQLINGSSRVEDTSAPLARGSVPVGASPDGKFLYVAGPAQSNEKCTFGSAGSTAAMWLYAQPVDEKLPAHRILTNYVFFDPKMVQGPSDKVVVSDSCNGPTRHVIATAETNGALSIDRVIPSPPTAPLAVDGAAWSASGTGLYLKGEGVSGWYLYDFTNGLSPATEIAPGAQVVEQMANGQIVSVAKRGATWAVSVGKNEIVALTAPTHGDFARAVRVDTRHRQLAIAGKDSLVVLKVGATADTVDMGTFQYAAEALTWASDGIGLVAAPRAGGLEYLSFAAVADNRLSKSSLGFNGVAYSLLSVPTSSSLVIQQGVAVGEVLEAGEAYILKLTS